MNADDMVLNAPVAKVLPGERIATVEDVTLVTLLGSCVAVCLQDPALGIGGMNHFMLPEGTLASVVSAPARYGVYAMELLLNDLMKLGASRRRLQAKVFGGGNVLRGFGAITVGHRNVAFIGTYLEREGIPVLAQDVLGTHPRKVAYSPRSGKALVMRLASANAEQLQHAESSYQTHLRQRPLPDNNIEMFQ
jgi:chemotaxis protein CheD